jgi:hypothetical protein
MEKETLPMIVIASVLMALTAWFHAKLTVLHKIRMCDSPEVMLREMLTNTIMWSVIATFCYLMFTWGWVVLLYITLRFITLALMDWDQMCDQFKQIKAILARY